MSNSIRSMLLLHTRPSHVAGNCNTHTSSLPSSPVQPWKSNCRHRDTDAGDALQDGVTIGRIGVERIAIVDLTEDGERVFEDVQEILRDELRRGATVLCAVH